MRQVGRVAQFGKVGGSGKGLVLQAIYVWEMLVTTALMDGVLCWYNRLLYIKTAGSGGILSSKSLKVEYDPGLEIEQG